MKHDKLLLASFIVLGIIISASGVLAQTSACPITIQAKTTTALLTELPSINTALSSCSTPVPPQLKKLIKNGIFLFDITETDDVAITIQNGIITGVNKVNGGNYNYKLTLTSCQLDYVLSHTNSVGAFIGYYLNGQAKLTAAGLVGKLKLFFANLFGKKALQSNSVPVPDCAATSKKPTNCYETYMQGHEQYQYGKKTWDAWLAETGHICQTQTSEAPKGGECKHLFEQIKNNDKKWLCWY